MRSIHRAYSRALITTAATGAAMSIALLSGAGPAWAHVTVNGEDATPGSDDAVLTFQVPGESEKGALTTELTVTLPNLASARAEVMPGWTAKLDRDVAAGTVRSVTWTAAPSTGISTDQFERFSLAVTLPNQPSVTFPATQTYSDGTVVKWDQPPLPNGEEPEHPVPTLNLTGPAGQAPDQHQPPPATPPAETSAAPPVPAASPDNTARWLAGGALLLAAAGLVAALTGRRRT